MELDDIRWLTSNEGAGALDLAASLTGELTTRIRRLRATLTARQAALVIEQLDLRHRARDKFSAAERMFFTPVGLEQATDEIVARHKAARFAGRAQVFDLCTGIGGDLVALASSGAATGFDRDPATALVAESNAVALGLAGVAVRTDDVTAIDLTACTAWHLDPDRRPAGRRTTRVDAHEPSAEAIETMLTRNANGAVKLAPAAQWPAAWSAEAEWEWISRGRQCRQLVAWFGDLARDRGRHRATKLEGDGRSASIVGEPGEEVPRAAAVERYVFEPDAAVLAAKLSAALAARHDLSAVAPGIAYWTGPTVVGDPLLAEFEVLDVLPFDLKRLKALLRERGAGPLEIKVRGLDEDPGMLRKRLATRGSEPLVLLLTRIEQRATAILARRVTRG